MSLILKDAEKLPPKRRGQKKETAIQAVEVLGKSWRKWVKCRSQAYKEKCCPYTKCYGRDEQSKLKK